MSEIAYAVCRYWDSTSTAVSVRGHADVDHGDIRLLFGDEAEELLGVAGFAYDLEFGAEGSSKAGSKQRSVVCEDQAHGKSAETRVPAPGGLSTRRRPSMAATRSARPRSPVPCLDRPLPLRRL